jgi:homoserine kinase type II
MLWESVDPADALSKRFGFADADAAISWMTDMLLNTWAIAVQDCDHLIMSGGNLLAWVTTTDEQRLIAKWSVFPSLFQHLADTMALSMWLHDAGIPVAAPIPASDGRLRVEQDNVSVGVVPVIDGELLDVDDLAQVADAGHMLATLHDAMLVYPHAIGGGPTTRRHQLVHNDFRSANLLHDGSGIRAVLDFEAVTYSTRVADLAKATVLLGTRYHDWGATSLLVREAFVEAYRERSPLTAIEYDEVQRRVAAIAKEFGWE